MNAQGCISSIVNSKHLPRAQPCYKVLNEKGKIAYIERGKGGLLYKYWPKMSMEEFNSHAVREIIGSLVNKFGKGMVTSCFTEELSKK